MNNEITKVRSEVSNKMKFKPDYRIAKLSGLGILGFFLGTIFLFYPDLRTLNTPDSIFHEIIYVPKDIISNPIASNIDSLEKDKSRLNNEINNISLLKKDSDPHANDSLNNRNNELISQINIDNNNIKKFKVYQGYYNYTSLNDTESFTKLNNALHFYITPDSIKNWDNRYNNSNDSLFASKFSFKDPDITYSLLGLDTLRIKRYLSDVEFITKYPSAGMWLLLVFIFCSFLLIAISTSVYLKEKIFDLFKDNEIIGLSSGDYYWVTFFTFITLLILTFIWSRTFYDDEIIKNLFFMRSLTISMNLVIFLGYLAGAFCLAGFIHTASMLGYFAKNIKSKRKEITEQKVRILKQADEILKENQISGKDMNEDQAQKVSKSQTALVEQETEHSKNKAIYVSLVGYFNTYFMLSAIILSLMVLCTGGLFSTVNSLDFVKLLADDWGYSPARTDFIYLYGGLHTVILLLVYIPAKMRFSEINIADEGISTSQSADGKWYQILKNPFGQLKNVLIATSPLLAGIVQSLFELLFK